MFLHFFSCVDFRRGDERPILVAHRAKPDAGRSVFFRAATPLIIFLRVTATLTKLIFFHRWLVLAAAGINPFEEGKAAEYTIPLFEFGFFRFFLSRYFIPLLGFIVVQVFQNFLLYLPKFHAAQILAIARQNESACFFADRHHQGISDFAHTDG